MSALKLGEILVEQGLLGPDQMAQAIEELYPGVKLTIGPAIENGFYYDIDLGETKISEDNLQAIEEEMEYPKEEKKKSF